MTAQRLIVICVAAFAIFGAFYYLGYQQGARNAAQRVQKFLVDERNARIQRWTPGPLQSHGELGSVTRLLSDFEDAIYSESRHALDAQYGSGDEQQHVAIAAQLHGDVRRLRGRILDRLETVPAPITPDVGEAGPPQEGDAVDSR